MGPLNSNIGEQKIPGLNRLTTLDRGNQLWFRYQGRSMWPYFLDGDLLVVERVAFAMLRRGDCIVFRAGSPEVQIVHRIVRISPEVLTKGDNRPGIDDHPVAPSALAGRVVTRIRYARPSRVSSGSAGRAAGWLHHQAGRLEPARQSRGGALGRLLAQLLRPLALLLLRRARIASFLRAGGPPTCYLMWRGRAIGTQDQPGAAFSIIWPYSLLFGSKLSKQ